MAATIYCPIQNKRIPVGECDLCSYKLKELFQRDNDPEAKCVAYLTPESAAAAPRGKRRRREP